MSPALARRRPRRPVRLADAGEQRRDQLRRRRHPGGRRPAQSRGRRARSRARAARSTCAAGRRRTTSDIPLEELQRMPPSPASPAWRRRRHRSVTGTPDPPPDLDVAVTPITAMQRAAGGSGRPQALPHPRAGHGRRAQPEAGRAAAARRRPGRARLSAAHLAADDDGRGSAPAQRCSWSPATATEEGLGLPLPAGRSGPVRRRRGRPILLGEGTVARPRGRRGRRDRARRGAGRDARSSRRSGERRRLARLSSSSSPTTAPRRSASRPSSRDAGAEFRLATRLGRRDGDGRSGR